MDTLSAGHDKTNRITFQIDGNEMHFKVILSFITGDNLFLNVELGFVESFDAALLCRHCTLSKINFQLAFFEKTDCIRTPQSYAADVALNNVQQTGIKCDSVFNSLEYFKAATNSIQDVMHNVLEGICSYDLRLICHSLKTEG